MPTENPTTSLRYRMLHLKRKHGVTGAANAAHVCVSSFARLALIHHVRDQDLTSLQHADGRRRRVRGTGVGRGASGYR